MARRKLQLSETGLSDKPGGVTHVSTTLRHALEQERHFALMSEDLSMIAFYFPAFTPVAFAA
jgi:hypothetical protein